MNRKDFRPSSRSSNISAKDKAIINKNSEQKDIVSAREYNKDKPQYLKIHNEDGSTNNKGYVTRCNGKVKHYNTKKQAEKEYKDN